MTTEGGVEEAIKKAFSDDGLSLIEVVLDRDDVARTVEWGARAAACNSLSARV